MRRCHLYLLRPAAAAAILARERERERAIERERERERERHYTECFLSPDLACCWSSSAMERIEEEENEEAVEVKVALDKLRDGVGSFSAGDFDGDEDDDDGGTATGPTARSARDASVRLNPIPVEKKKKRKEDGGGCECVSVCGATFTNMQTNCTVPQFVYRSF
jgi:hypothetical protein